MKKIKVIVKEKHILELVENANVGDIIDLKELLEVDSSYIEAIIDSGKDKVYESKLAAAKQLVASQKDLELAKYLEEINLLKAKNKSDLELKEQEIKSKYADMINSLKNQIESLTKDNLVSLESLANKNKLDLAQMNQAHESRYQELDTNYKLLLSDVDSKVKQKGLEIENKYLDEINKLKNELALLEANKKAEIDQIMVNAELSKTNALNAQKELYVEELKSREEVINNLQRQKANMNVKQTGEDLESWCDNEVTSYMQNGLFNCTWVKDNKVVKEDGDSKGSKADYIFNIYASNSHLANELLASICLDMKDENPDSNNKKKNADHYKALDNNRNKKNCKYAVLVSNLEIDKPNVLPIFKVREFDNMYVVRPGYLMTFLNMVASLTTRFSELILSKESESIELRSKLDLIEAFNSIKNTYLDKPLELLEKQIGIILKSSASIKKAANDVDEACDKINCSYISQITSKINNFELKLEKQIIKKIS